MLTKQELNCILIIFAEGVKELFGDKLKGLILFGSYARGDFDEDSDIDVMVLVDIDSRELYKYRSLVSRIATKAEWDYDALLTPIIRNYAEFEAHKDFMPFYFNVNKEGVNLIA